MLETRTHRGQGISAKECHVARRKRGKVGQCAFLDRQRAVHIGLADIKIRVQIQFVVQCPAVQPNCHARPGAPGEDVASAIGVYDFDGADADYALEQMGKKHLDLPSCLLTLR